MTHWSYYWDYFAAPSHLCASTPLPLLWHGDRQHAERYNSIHCCLPLWELQCWSLLGCDWSRKVSLLDQSWATFFIPTYFAGALRCMAPQRCSSIFCICPILINIKLILWILVSLWKDGIGILIKMFGLFRGNGRSPMSHWGHETSADETSHARSHRESWMSKILHLYILL
jgi:hypothetical protein